MQLVARYTYTAWALTALIGCAQGAASAPNEPFSAGNNPARVADASAGENAPSSDAGGQPNPGSGTGSNGDSDMGTGPGNPPSSGLDAGSDESDAGGGPSGPPDAGPISMPTPDAALPPGDPCAEICKSDIAPDAKTCKTAVTIGRKSALADDFVYNGDTRGDGNNQDLNFINCADGNADNFFRIYLYKDDVITARISTAEYDPVLTLTQGACTAPVAAACRDVGLDGESELLTVSIEEDGWHHVVADGPYGSTALEGQGRYTLSVSVDDSVSKGKCNCQ